MAIRQNVNEEHQCANFGLKRIDHGTSKTRKLVGTCFVHYVLLGNIRARPRLICSLWLQSLLDFVSSSAPLCPVASQLEAFIPGSFALCCSRVLGVEPRFHDTGGCQGAAPSPLCDWYCGTTTRGLSRLRSLVTADSLHADGLAA
jgi:hypothetical protein